MRDILFRGKRLNNGEWAYGNFCDFCEYHNILVPGTCIGSRVDPSTVGQFTGLLDKNGKRIFEGDIVEHAGKRFVIEYIEKYCRFAGTRPGIVFAGFAFYHCEKIGNIHDNPELLKED